MLRQNSYSPYPIVLVMHYPPPPGLQGGGGVYSKDLTLVAGEQLGCKFNNTQVTRVGPDEMIRLTRYYHVYKNLNKHVTSLLLTIS